jgi:anti-sigma regulatory factor (Ser/Thr protein kinase)
VPGEADREASIELAPHPRYVGVARRFVRQQLDDWDIADVAPAAELVISELVSNAVLHARSPLRLRLCAQGLGLLVEVTDDSPSRPVRRHYSEDATTGRGLAMVEVLTTGEWGSRPEGAGKIVWARLQPGGDERGEPDLELFVDLGADLDAASLDDTAGGRVRDSGAAGTTMLAA